MKKKTAWLVYILECADGTLYTGCTKDLEKRLVAHNQGTGAKYTATPRPVRVRYTETAASRSAALKREWEIKQLSRQQKVQLLA